MRQNSLSLWYLNNYINEEKEDLELYENNTFDSFGIKVNLCDDKGRYIHYLEAADFNRTLLRGCAGSGKTYVLKRILKSNLCRSSKHIMYFDLRDYNGGEFLDYICKKIGCRDITRAIINDLLYNGEISFVFDNYYELDFVKKNMFNRKVLNNDELKNIKFIICSEENINEVEFDKVYYIKSFSTREVYKKIIRTYFDDYYEFKKFKDYLKSNNLESLLYKPLNLNCMIKVIESNKEMNFIYKFKSENDLYARYIKETFKSKRVVNTLAYIAYYLVRKSLSGISEEELRALTAEALREYDKDADIDKTLYKIKRQGLEKSRFDKDIYRFKNKSVMMSLVYKYLKDNKIKVKNIIHNEYFSNYIIWKCSIDEKFIYENIFEFDDELLSDILECIEDKKVEKFYSYIELFFSGKPFAELMRKLNIIFQRFRWEEEVQEKTLEFLTSIEKQGRDLNNLMADKIVSYICENENIKDVYKLNEKRWLEESSKSELVRKTYVNIIKADYIEEYKIYRKISMAAASIER